MLSKLGRFGYIFALKTIKYDAASGRLRLYLLEDNAVFFKGICLVVKQDNLMYLGQSEI